MSQQRNDAEKLIERDLFADEEPAMVVDRASEGRQQLARARPIMAEAAAAEGEWSMVSSTMETASQRLLWFGLCAFLGFALGAGVMTWLVG